MANPENDLDVYYTVGKTHWLGISVRHFAKASLKKQNEIPPKNHCNKWLLRGTPNPRQFSDASTWKSQ